MSVPVAGTRSTCGHALSVAPWPRNERERRGGLIANKHRRHLTPNQLAVAAGKADKLYEKLSWQPKQRNGAYPHSKKATKLPMWSTDHNGKKARPATT